MILLIVLIVGAILLDQGSKLLAATFLAGKETITLVPPRILELTYITNEGVAGGALAGNRFATIFFPALGLLVLAPKLPRSCLLATEMHFLSNAVQRYAFFLTCANFSAFFF